MGKLMIVLGAEAEERLRRRAESEGKSPEVLAAELLDLMLVPLHTMDSERVRLGYEECGALEVAIAERGKE